MLRFVAAALILCGACAADDRADREKLWGTWTSTQGTEKGAPASIILKGDGTTVHVTTTQGTETLSDFECNTMGKQCKVKSAGRDATVTMYFNGPRLVELETNGKEVVKRRYHVSDDGTQLELEVMPIAP